MSYGWAGKEFAMQIYCFQAPPATRYIKVRGSKRRKTGQEIPGALVLRANVDCLEELFEDWKTVARECIYSLQQGDSTYVHCMAGIHRAGIVAAGLRAKIQGESLKEALAQIQKVRQIRPRRIMEALGDAGV